MSGVTACGDDRLSSVEDPEGQPQGEPVGPTAPTSPTGPTGPEPSGPTGPSSPVEPTGPTGATGPTSPAGPVDDAIVLSHALPPRLDPGQTYVGLVTLQNVGTTTWSQAGGYALGSPDDSDTFAPSRIPLEPHVAIAPGEIHTFPFIMRALLEQATYLSDWRMVHELVAWFGETATSDVAVNWPYEGEDNAEVVGEGLPVMLLPGQELWVFLTFKNIGSTVWRASDGYFLGAVGDEDPFASIRIALPDDVAPGETVSFDWPMLAPLEPNSYFTDWQMVRDGHHWFGDIKEKGTRVETPDDFCDNPLPPPLSHMGVKIHNDQGFKKTLDSTPIVSDRDYCTLIGFTDNRAQCPPRTEGHPESDMCSYQVVGVAADTGRPGPTWRMNGALCEGTDGASYCRNHSGNQFLVFAFGSGTFEACATSGGCNSITIP